MNVVVVDDEPTLARAVASLIQDAGHDVWTVTSEFDRLLDPAFWDDVDAALVDFRLGPGISGLDVIRFLHTRRPDVRVVAWSAAGEELESRIEGGIAVTLLAKPAPTEAIMAVLTGDPTA